MGNAVDGEAPCQLRVCVHVELVVFNCFRWRPQPANASIASPDRRRSLMGNVGEVLIVELMRLHETVRRPDSPLVSWRFIDYAPQQFLVTRCQQVPNGKPGPPRRPRGEPAPQSHRQLRAIGAHERAFCVCDDLQHGRLSRVVNPIRSLRDFSLARGRPLENWLGLARKRQPEEQRKNGSHET